MEKLEMFEVMKVTEEVESNFNQIEVVTAKKRKNKVQEDHTERTKKPRSAYLLYYFDVHQIMQLGIPNLPQSEINKRISESWKRLSVAEKSYYLEKAKLEKEGMDTSSLSPSNDLPGFRKILPRASYYVLSKGCSSNHQPGGSQSELSTASLDGPVEEAMHSISATQESQFTPLGLGEEIELSEQPIVVEGIVEETADMSPSVALRGIPPSSSASISIKGSASTHSCVPQASADLLANVTAQTGSETTAASSEYCGTMMQQTPGDAAQVVAIIPTQNLLEPKSLSGVNTVGPVMMVSVGAGIEQTTKPSYKMSAKTYTRRGHGRCLNPGCSFMYVTRHKPPTCPECGNHLGGKWIPEAKKTEEKGTPDKKKQQMIKSKSNQSFHAAPPPPQRITTDDKTNIAPNAKELQQSFKKQRPLSAREPPEGSSIKTQAQTQRLKNNPEAAVVEGQDRNTVAVQRRPMRPILPACYSTGRPLFQFITVLPEKGKCQSANNNKSASVPPETFSGLKPSTLKQLGLTVPATTTTQDPDSADRSQSVSQTDKIVNVLSFVPFKRQTVSSFDLGLSTARGRGRCGNPSCDYMYKNRHKPALCPKCGFELTQKKTKTTKSASVLDPYQALSPAQKEIQRQSTLQLLRSSLQIPESETELQETLTLIQEFNRLQIVLFQRSDQPQEDGDETETLIEPGWPLFYESAATHCGLCSYPLFKGSQSTVAGHEDCWLLTETLMQTASLQLKVCLNVQCLALHSFTDLHPGLFNIGNRLLVSIDLFLKIRSSIKAGLSPSQAVRTVLDHAPNHPVHALSPDESSQIHELLLSGYWAFECLTVRDYNDMICGVCGVAPKVEIAQRHTKNVLELKNVEFTWPECSVSDEVHVDDFWLTMESEAIEQAAFPTDIPITRVDASIIAPFTPPLMRSAVVINTEKDKVLSPAQQASGEPSVLVRLIHDGELRLNQLDEHTEDELRAILDRCGATVDPDTTKTELLASLTSLSTLVQSGLPTASQPPAHLTAGTLSKVCPHKVVCSSKYLVRGETARDHVDLLLSSRYWPPVYVCDCARQVALCTDMQYPELAAQMWGRNQGCFSDPFEKPELVSCEELQEQPYRVDLSLVAENQHVHPVTRSSSCWMVHPPEAQRPPAAAEHHSMGLCRDLEPYVGLVSELSAEGEEKDPAEETEELAGKQEDMVFNNTAYYYLYNRLVDFLTSRDIVSQQINQVVKACQPGEVVIRDALYRLGVAQIKTEKEDGEGSGLDAQTQEEGMETYEVVLHDNS